MLVDTHCLNLYCQYRTNVSICNVEENRNSGNGNASSQPLLEFVILGKFLFPFMFIYLCCEQLRLHSVKGMDD